MNNVGGDALVSLHVQLSGKVGNSLDRLGTSCCTITFDESMLMAH